MPRDLAASLEGFLAGLGLQEGIHFSMNYVTVWWGPANGGYQWGARFILLRPLTVRPIRKRGFNRIRVEVSADAIFAPQVARGT